MGTTTGVAQPSGVLITVSEAEIAAFWNDLENCNRTFVLPVMNQSPAQLLGLAPQIQFNGLSLLLDIGLACTTPHHSGLHSMFSILKYPSLISELPAFRFRDGTAQIDTHKKKVISDEFGCGAAFMVARSFFQKTQFLDFQTAVAVGLVQTNAPQSRQPDYLAWGPQSSASIMLLEAKGTQTSLSYAATQIVDACEQLIQGTVIAPGYSQARVAVALALMRENSGDVTTIYVGDPDPQPKYTFTPSGEVVEVIRRSHYLRTALFTRDVELATYLKSGTVDTPHRTERRDVQGNTYFGSSLVMRSESSTLSFFVGLDARIRTALLHDEGGRLRPSVDAIDRTHRETGNRTTIIQSEGICLDLIRGENG
ncbi:MAG: hypothetical protein JWM08_979 [Candidatus Angelobacter sp.]|nr:hypothetical protein [Candidatus Angelobacter sp.]